MPGISPTKSASPPEDNLVGDIDHPPISPALALIEPLNSNLPILESNTKFDELISIFEFELLTNAVELPKKNVDELIIIFVPSNESFEPLEFPSKNCPLPLKKIPLPVVWLLPTSGPSDILPPREELILKSPPFILIFPVEPLIKVLRFPKKKFDELIN